MRPLRLELEGFTSFRERTVVSFENTDLFVLTGATGSGKSSLIDAMVFALYGSVPRYGDRRLVAPVISQGMLRARVRLDFEAGGRNLTAVRLVQRTASGGASTKEARLEQCGRDGSPSLTLASTADDLSATIEGEVIGLGLDHFTKCVVLPQGEFATFMRAKPRERQDLLTRLLDLGLYDRLRERANQGARDEGNRAEALQQRLDTELSSATEEAVQGAEARLGTLEDLRDRIRETVPKLDELDEAVDTAKKDERNAKRLLDSLEGVHVPDGTEALAEKSQRAERAVTDARTVEDQAVVRREAADKVRRSLPERASLEASRAGWDRLTGLQRKRSELTYKLERAEKELSDAKDSEAAASAGLDEAELALKALPERAEIIGIGEKREEVAKRETEITESRRELADTDRLLDDAKEAEATARDHLRAAHEALAHIRVEHAAADLRGHLREGEPCPVCLQEVGSLPKCDEFAEIEAAEVAVREAETAADRARTEREGRDRRRAAVDASLTEQRKSAEALRESLKNAPTPEKATELLARIKDTGMQVDDARRKLDEARKRRERCASHRDQVKMKHEMVTGDLRDLKNDLVDAPNPEEISCLLEDIAAADHALKEAGAQEAEARERTKNAQSHLDSLEARRRSAWRKYRDTRDGVAGLGPPVSREGDLAGSWTDLTDWAGAREREQRKQLEVAQGTAAAATTEGDKLRSGLIALCREGGLELGEGDDPATRCAEALGSARSSLHHLRTAREERGRVEARLREVRHRAAVASELGTHLSARGFGQWLQNRILRHLVSGATARLKELSRGQYSLDLNSSNEFQVIDHRNADQARPARTLSGGETFLASLALALSLAEQVAGLAASGNARLESLFLDEGFGTLDPETLDVVAATIDQLGAERMVGLVTHVPELAERIPVQYKVRKVGNSSSVERVET